MSNKVVKAGVWYTVCNFLTKGAVFLSTPFFTRMMTKSDIGSFSNMASWLEILIPIVTLEFTVSLNIARFDYKNELNNYILSTLVYGSIITSCLYAIAFFNMDYICKFFSLKPYMIHIMFIYMLVYPALQMFQCENRFRYKYIMSTVVSLSSVIISVSISVFLTNYINDRLFGRIIGYYGVLIIYNVFLYFYLIKRGKSFSWKYFRYAFVISFPMIWHTLSLRLLNAGDRIVITQTIGEEANAFYTIATTCSHIVAVLYSSMNNAWSPWATEKMNEGQTEIIKEKSRYYIVFYSIILVLFLFVCPELLLLMGGHSYMKALYVLPPVIVSCVFQFVYSLYINAEFYLKKQTRIAVGTILASVINIILNYIFVPKYGYVAAAYTTLVGYILLFFFHLISLKMLKKDNWYDNRFNLKIVGIFIVVLLFMNLIYINNVLRYGFLSIYLFTLSIICIKKRDDIKPFFSMFIKKRK